ncbi:hypothetical protein BDN72DRAFT_488162 [Pluteus cervinus]|uniref:Uncharacterized protein n=1 Tax=Pluteus cervinus TaxID=181527 RepID=A0ACD3AZA3_9AGAR|nr:hypothetical protein BDN72DRAFT_488162 [Pluteus cervinus]
MQFSFFRVTSALFAGLTFQTINAAPSTNVNARGIGGSILTTTQMLKWITTTDANLTYINTPPEVEPFSKRQDQQLPVVIVVSCTEQVNNTCGGACTIMRGSGAPTCLNTPGANCVLATADFQLCTGSACDGTCTSLTECIDDETTFEGFCAIPGTNSLSLAAESASK